MTSHCGLFFNPIFLLYHINFPRSRSIPPTSPCASHYRNEILLPSHKAYTQRYCRDSRKSYFAHRHRAAWNSDTLFLSAYKAYSYSSCSIKDFH